MSVALPIARLLLASLLMILTPIALAANTLSPLWLVLPLAPVTATSIVLQGYKGLGVHLACIASNALMLGGVYIAAFAVFRLIN